MGARSRTQPTVPLVRKSEAADSQRKRALPSLIGLRPGPGWLLNPMVTGFARLWRCLGSWRQALALVAIAAPLRFWRLGHPNSLVFDETYYAKDAWALLKYGVERDVVEDADLIVNNGGDQFFSEEAAYVVHPPFGKWVIALGEGVFGMNPFGWRFAVALLGVIAVILVQRTMIALGASQSIAFLAGLAMAVDGIAIVLSRTALLDQVLMFTVLVAVWSGVKVIQTGMRRHLVLMAVALGLATATKWSGLWYAVALFSVLFVVDLCRKQRPRMSRVATAFRHALVGVSLVTVTYLMTWAGWLLGDDGWGRGRTSGVSWLPQPLRALLEYHRNNYSFHTGLTADHPYGSDPLGWLLMLRPTSFWYTSNDTEMISCGAPRCAGEVLALGNVVIWWVAVFAAVVFLGMFILNRLQEAERLGVLIPLLGLFAGWAPWLMYRERTTFNFYMIVVTPYICMLFAWFISMIAQPGEAPKTAIRATLGRKPAAEGAVGGGELTKESATTPCSDQARDIDQETHDRLISGDTVEEPAELHVGVFTARALIALTLVLAMLAVSVFFYPVWSGMTLTREAWEARMWFPSWI